MIWLNPNIQKLHKQLVLMCTRFHKSEGTDLSEVDTFKKSFFFNCTPFALYYTYAKNEQRFTVCGPLSFGHESINCCSAIWGIFDHDALAHLLDFSHHSWRIAEGTKTRGLVTWML